MSHRQGKAELGQPPAMNCRSSLKIDAAEARLVLSEFAQPGAGLTRRRGGLSARDVQPGSDVAGVQAPGDRIAAVRCPQLVDDSSGRRDLTRGEVGLAGNQTRGSRRQPKPVFSQLGPQPQRGSDESARRATGGQVALKQHEFRRSPPPVVAASPEPAAGARGQPARFGELAGQQRALRSGQFGLGQVLGHPVASEDGRGLRQHVVGFADQAGFDEQPRPVEQ
jgi:hypothetical protein